MWKRKLVIIVVVIIAGFLIVISLYGGKKSSSNNVGKSNSTNNTRTSSDNNGNSSIDNSKRNNFEIQEAEEKVETIYTENPVRVTNKTYLYSIKNTISKFISDVAVLNKTTDKTKYNVLLKKIYSQLSKKYINKNNITKENVDNWVYKDIDDISFKIVDMLELKIENNQVYRYVVRTRFERNNGEEYYLNFIFYLDYLSRTYSIEPIDNNIIDLTTVDLKTEMKDVPKNEYNVFHFKVVVD